MKFSINVFFSKFAQIRSFLRIELHLLKKSLMESFIFCAVFASQNMCYLFSMLITKYMKFRVIQFPVLI